MNTETETENEDFGVLLVRDEPLRDKILPWLIVVLIVLTTVAVIRSFVIETAVEDVQDAAEDVGTTASDARDAAVDARDELRAAIRAIEASGTAEPEVANQAILDALHAVARIEVYLCGGPCPE